MSRISIEYSTRRNLHKFIAIVTASCVSSTKSVCVSRAPHSKDQLLYKPLENLLATKKLNFSRYKKQGKKVTKARRSQDFSHGEYPTTIKHNLIGMFQFKFNWKAYC